MVIWAKSTPGLNGSFQKAILDGEEVTKDRVDTTDYFGIMDSIISEPSGGAIGIDPRLLNSADINKISPNPDITAPITLVYKKDSKVLADIKKLVVFMESNEVQQKYFKK